MKKLGLLMMLLLLSRIALFCQSQTAGIEEKEVLKNEDVVFSDNYVDITDACGISVSVDKAELKSCTSLKERVSVFSVGESYEARQ